VKYLAHRERKRENQVENAEREYPPGVHHNLDHGHLRDDQLEVELHRGREHPRSLQM
jgi:hypothetical protein